MALVKGLGNFFALDIGTSAVRVVQLSKSGSGSWNLQHFGYVPIDERVATSNSVEGMNRLGEAIMTAIGQSGIKEKNVVIGLSSSKTFTTVIDVPIMADNEFNNVVKYQIDQYIPISVDDAKVDWAVLGQSSHDDKKREVLIASTTKAYAEERLEFVESLGFNVIAAEPEGVAIVRSILPSGLPDARLIIDVGELATDLAITFSDSPRLVRNIPTGIRSLVKVVSQNLSVELDQARQFVLKFGLMSDKLEGQVYRSIEPTVDNFSADIIKSIKFFQTRYPEIAVGGILLSGFASVIPQFGEYIASKTGIPTAIANPWQRVHVSADYQQQLGSIAFEFAAAIGLAQRRNDK